MAGHINVGFDHADGVTGLLDMGVSSRVQICLYSRVGDQCMLAMAACERIWQYTDISCSQDTACCAAYYVRGLNSNHNCGKCPSPAPVSGQERRGLTEHLLLGGYNADEPEVFVVVIVTTPLRVEVTCTAAKDATLIMAQTASQ